MKHLLAFKWLTVLVFMPFMWTFAYGEPETPPDLLDLVGSSKYYGRMTKIQAAEIIEKCAKETYEAKALVEENDFFMGVPTQSYPHASGKRTTTKFTWARVKQIEVLKRSIKISYESLFFGVKKDKSLVLSGKTYNLADLALAAMTLTGLPLTPEQPVPDDSDAPVLENSPVTGGQSEPPGQTPGVAQGAKGRQSGPDLEKRLLKLKDLYDKGLLSEAVYQSKQKELLERMLDE